MGKREERKRKNEREDTTINEKRKTVPKRGFQMLKLYLGMKV